jgi:16S rRNA C967 or C1407 C5-methylase (RsmB/RsmF family)/NOL1/NOP2/fmu family ribosome biogenesis protein
MHLPEEFIRQTRPLLGDEWPAFERALQAEPPVSIRRNPRKRPSTLAFPLDAAVPWASDASYLLHRPSFTLDPLFHAGCYYVQEASSMYLETLLRPHLRLPLRALDLCAAPGGKSTHLLSLLPEGSLLVANEAIRSRISALSENLIRWGYSAYAIAHDDPARIGRLDGFFDLLLADLPCSGEGLFRKDPLALRQWSPAHVRLCADRQKRILADAWPALRPGGLLIYSTCTYNESENEDNLHWIALRLGAEPVDAPRRFFSHRTRGEGFFIAILRKNGEEEAANLDFRSKKHIPSVASSLSTAPLHYLMHPDRFALFADRNRTLAFPADRTADYHFLRRHLNILSAGIDLGEQKGVDRLPSHALALSTDRHPAAFPTFEADLATALRYLRKEALPALPATLPKGYVLIAYDGHPLGFVKNIGPRANNLYPVALRIRMQG